MNDSLPDHLARYADLLDDYPEFVRALGTPLPQSIALNRTRAASADLTTRLADDLHLEPLSWYPGAWRLAPEDRPGRHWGFNGGLFCVQEEASLLPVALLAPRPADCVLDLCAAPGNKTAHIALAVGDRGTVIANDVKSGRLTALHDLVRRMGLTNVATTARDGTTWPLAAGGFDRVLVDAPCSAEGKAQRGVRRGASPAFRAWISRIQRALLSRALTVVRPGGRVVYSTCTFAPEENELVVADVLEALDAEIDVRIVDAAARPPGSDAGLVHFAGRSLPEGLRHGVRMWPHRTETGGFFAIALERVGPDTASYRQESLPPAAPDSLVRELIEPWGIAAHHIDELHFFQAARHLRATSRHLRVPQGIDTTSIGLDFARLGSRNLKPSAAGAMWLGPHATFGTVDLDSDQLAHWRARRDQPVPPDAADLHPGNVLVRHDGFTIGTAYLRGNDPPVLESHCPRAWSTVQ